MFLQNFLYSAVLMQSVALVTAYIVHNARKACAESDRRIIAEYHHRMDEAMIKKDIEAWEIAYRSFRYYMTRNSK